jgi:hypothetical protein
MHKSEVLCTRKQVQQHETLADISLLQWPSRPAGSIFTDKQVWCEERQEAQCVTFIETGKYVILERFWGKGQTVIISGKIICGKHPIISQRQRQMKCVYMYCMCAQTMFLQGKILFWLRREKNALSLVFFFKGVIKILWLDQGIIIGQNRTT